jgi:hypothetical protein
MAAKTHLLRPESVTPIARYLERVRTGVASPVEFACVLLYREREYRTMYASSWRPDRLPAPDEAGPFAPHGLTLEAAAAIGAAVRGAWGTDDASGPVPPDDLFGLKDEALRRLRDGLRTRKADAFGYLVASRLATDLCRYEEAVALARAASAVHGDAVAARALELQAARLAPEDASFDRDAVAAAATRVARALLTKQRTWRRDWDRRALERFDEQIRRRAIGARTKVEGARFTKYLSTEAGFCERERREAMKRFDARAVPADLRRLIPAARRFGVGDDVCRPLFIRKAPKGARAAVVKSVDAQAPRIDRWLKELEGAPYGREAAAFFWLLEAVEELRHG